MVLQPSQYALEQGSTILVTGANGFIASNIADAFLARGYRVRGTTRSPSKNAWLKARFDREYGPGAFEFAHVPDMSVPNAYDEAVKGVSAVIHTATVFTLDPNPHNVVPGTIAGTLNALEAAAREPSVKRFVLTSSSLAAVTPKPNVQGIRIEHDAWNDEAVESAYADPPYTPNRALVAYAASKVLGEKEAWKFVKEKKPGFVFNAVLPNTNFGRSLDYEGQGHPSTSSIVAALFKGDTKFLGGITPQYYIDVEDCALLHVAAALHPGVQNERVFAFAAPMNGNKVLAVLRKLYPNRTFPEDFDSTEDLSEIVQIKRAEELLREFGQEGWTSLEESLRKNTEDIVD